MLRVDTTPRVSWCGMVRETDVPVYGASHKAAPNLGQRIQVEKKTEKKNMCVVCALFGVLS